RPPLHKPGGCLARKEQMIDAQTLVFLPGARLVIPEGVLARRVGEGAQSVRQAQSEKRLKALSRGRSKQGIIDPGGCIVDVLGLRNDIEVAGKNKRFFRLESLLRVLEESRHPFE